MNIINTYIKDLTFTKVHKTETYDVYIAKIHDMMAGGKHRYILLFVNSNDENPVSSKVENLDWINLQTRVMSLPYKLTSQKWTPDFVVNIPLQVESRNDQYTTYVGPSYFPFKVLLRHDPKKSGKHQYNNNILLSTALESYNATVNRM